MSAQATETPKSLAKFETEAFALAQAGVVKIVDQATYDTAIERFNAGQRWIKRFTAWIDEEWVKPTHAAWKKATTNKASILGPAEKIVNAQRAEVVRWDQEQQRKKRELERQAAEQARLEAEKIRLEKALEAEKAGYDDDSVAAILDEPVYVAPAPIEATYEKSAEIQMRDHWGAELDPDDKQALAKFAKWAVAQKRFGLLRIDPTAVGALAREIRDTAQIPGLRIANKPVVAQGRR